MDNENENQVKRILTHLQKYGRINSWEAITEYGATRLSAIIYILKNKYGYQFNDGWVKTSNRFGDRVKYKVYELKGDVK